MENNWWEADYKTNTISEEDSIMNNEEVKKGMRGMKDE